MSRRAGAGPTDMPTEVELLDALVGTWTTEGSHPELPDAIHGTTTFEWLDGRRFLIGRAHYEHPQIPDAVTVTGITDERLAMHYFDSRGVFRVYSVAMTPGTWRFWRDDPAFSQRFTGTFDDDGATITGRGSYSRDGGEWTDDLALTYRRR
jgi:hypothetical protein